MKVISTWAPAALAGRLLGSQSKAAPLPSRQKLYRALWAQARPCRKHLLMLLLFNLAATPLSLLYPWALKIVVDSVFGGLPLPAWLAWMVPASMPTATAALALAVALLLIVGTLVHVQILASWYLTTYTAQRMLLDFRSALFRHVQRLSLAFHNERPTSDTMYRIQQDAPSIQFLFVHGAIPLVSAVVAFTAMVVVTARLDWELAGIALAISPVLYLLARACTRRVRRRWHEVKEYDVRALSGVSESLSLLRVVKAFGQERRAHARFDHVARQHMEGQLWLAWVQGGFHLLVGVTLAIGTAAALYVGVRHVQQGVLTVGELIIVMAYLAHLYGPLNTISTKVPDMQEWLTSSERALSLFDELPEMEDDPRGRPLGRARGDVEFRNVTYAFNGRQPVLENVSFHIPAGSRVGIIGRTGTGKTTLVSLLMRFYDPTRGQVLLDGVDVRDYRITDLRNQFAMVLQEPVLFSASVCENISYGRPEASTAQIEEVAKAANAHDFITQLPRGYETEVGERGGRLSGGERQRVSIARSLLKDSPIQILDEPTSAVDIDTEAAIMGAIERLMEGRTTFMIAHRLSTLKMCDVILVLKDRGVAAVAYDVESAMQVLLGEESQAVAAGLS